MISSEPGLGERSALMAGAVGTFFISGTTGFVLLYLTDEVGLGTAAVGTLLLVARVADAVLDPVIGYLVDHFPATRWGRFRPYAFAGAIASALGLAALFTIPSVSPNPLLAAWLIYLVWGAALGLLTIPLVALVPAITSDASIRARLAGMIGLTGLLASSAMGALTLPLVDVFGGGTGGWGRYAVAVAVVSLGLMTILTIKVRERVMPRSADRYEVAEIRAVFFSDWAVPSLLISKVLMQSAAGALATALPFFFLYYMNDKALLSAAAGMMALPTAIAAILFPRLAHRSGVKPYYLLSLGCCIGGLGSLMVVPAQPVPVLACFAIASLGFGGLISLSLMLLVDLTDYIEYHRGYRAEASLSAMMSFATKAGTGIGAGAVAYLLALNGYREGADHQTAAAVHGVLLSQSLIPAALGLLGGAVFLTYPVNQAATLEARRALRERNEPVEVR